MTNRNKRLPVLPPLTIRVLPDESHKSREPSNRVAKGVCGIRSQIPQLTFRKAVHARLRHIA
jgi:hypothetical protein